MRAPHHRCPSSTAIQIASPLSKISSVDPSSGSSSAPSHRLGSRAATFLAYLRKGSMAHELAIILQSATISPLKELDHLVF